MRGHKVSTLLDLCCTIPPYVIAAGAPEWSGEGTPPNNKRIQVEVSVTASGLISKYRVTSPGLDDLVTTDLLEAVNSYNVR